MVEVVTTQIKATVTLDDNNYIVICNLKDNDNRVWECTFPRMNLLRLTTVVDQLFLSKELNANFIKFAFKESQVCVEKSTYEKQKDDIISQIVG